jgi:hypothetical protein
MKDKILSTDTLFKQDGVWEQVLSHNSELANKTCAHAHPQSNRVRRGTSLRCRSNNASQRRASVNEGPHGLVLPQKRSSDSEDRSDPQDPTRRVKNDGQLPPQLRSVADVRTTGKWLPLA